MFGGTYNDFRDEDTQAAFLFFVISSLPFFDRDEVLMGGTGLEPAASSV
jgi:hypothetical protein